MKTPKERVKKGERIGEKGGIEREGKGEFMMEEGSEVKED